LTAVLDAVNFQESGDVAVLIQAFGVCVAAQNEPDVCSTGTLTADASARLLERIAA
jgi:hypothetical protein